VTDLLAGAISTGKSSDPADTVLRNNMLSIYIAPKVYDKDGSVMGEIKRFAQWIKSSPPAKADAPVLLPGDIERATHRERSANGVPLDDKTLSDLVAAAASVGMDRSRVEAMLR
jgi:uncharacterized oxidoreductase